MEPNFIRIGNMLHHDRTILVERKYKFNDDNELLKILDYLEARGFKVTADMNDMVVIASDYENYFEFIKENPTMGTNVDFTKGEEE
jgi:hypothetical protein